MGTFEIPLKSSLPECSGQAKGEWTVPSLGGVPPTSLSGAGWVRT
jgi:hypothetical protein